MRWAFTAAAAAQLLGLASAFVPIAPLAHQVDPHAANVAGTDKLTPAAPSYTAGFFDQLIDHANPSLGTFKQRFWYNADNYNGPNSPIVLASPGESGVEEKFINFGSAYTPNVYAAKLGGASIQIEHRYFGKSLPYPEDQLNTETYQYHTLDNAVQDLINFAKNVDLPFTNGTSTPDVAPWVLVGCSYSGALAAWVHALSPNTFWAYHCGSAVVEAIEDFWTYFEPVKAALPKNCSADWQRIVKHVDTVLDSGDQTAKDNLKAKFNQSGTTDVQFAEALTGWLGNWQGQQLYSGYSQPFQVCDYIENQYPGSRTPNPDANGVGLDKAIAGFANATRANWWNIPPFDGLDGKSWSWYLCNEPFEWWQAYASADTTGFIPKLFTTQAAIKETCQDQFPDVNGHQYGLKKGRTVAQLNKRTGGWNQVNTKRLMWINGQFDPWRDATVSSSRRPGGPLKSTKAAPVFDIPKAAHCNDYIYYNANANPAAVKIFDSMVKQIVTWVDEFYA